MQPLSVPKAMPGAGVERLRHLHGPASNQHQTTTFNYIPLLKLKMISWGI